MQSEPATTAAIQHVALEIRRDQADRARHFWHLLGFDPVTPPPTLSERAIWMEAGPAQVRTQIHLLFTDADAPEAAFGGHVAIVVPQFGATTAALRDEGFEVEARRAHWGAERAYARHPGGHTVELMAAPPGSQ